MKYRIKDIIDFIRYSIPKGIKNLIKWFPLVWKDRDYDSSYILETLKFKIYNTRKLHEKNRRFVGVEKEIYYMKVCEILLDRLIKEEYSDSFYKLHDRKWGESVHNWIDSNRKGYKQLNLTRSNVKTEEDKKLESYEFRKYMKISKRNQDNDQTYLFNILNKRIQRWWD